LNDSGREENNISPITNSILRIDRIESK
jgi:hypothetical protein